MVSSIRSLGAAGAAKAPAAALFSWQDAYTKVEAMAEHQAAQQGAGRFLARAVKDTLVESVVGSNPDSTREIESRVRIDSNLRKHVFDPVSVAGTGTGVDDAIEAIERFVVQEIDAKISAITSKIDSKVKTELSDTYVNYEKKKSALFKALVDQLNADKKERVARGATTARAMREVRALEAQTVFKDEGDSLTPFLIARAKLTKALEQIQLEGLKDLGEGDIDVAIMLAGSKMTDEHETLLNRKLNSADKAISQIYLRNLGAYSHEGKSRKEVEMRIPSHLEKGKGEEFGLSMVSYTKALLSKYYVIHRYIKRIVNDRGEGSFWQPPRKSELFSGVPKHEIDDYRSQSKEIWDELSKTVHKDVWAKITQPKPSGYYGQFDVQGEIDDGVLAIYVLMMRYVPNDSNFCSKLIAFMANSPLLVSSPRVDVRQVVNDMGPPIKEIINLGVRIPWESTGLKFINALTKIRPPLLPYLHDLKRSAPDPEDSAIHFQTLLSRIESALNDEKEEVDGGKPELLAHESQAAPPPYAIKYVEGGSDEGWEIAKTPSEYYGYEGTLTGDHEYEGYSEEFHDAQEFSEEFMSEEGVPEPYYDSRDDPEVHIPTPPPEHHAYSTQYGSGYGGGKGKYRYSKGGYRPKGHGYGRGGKGGYTAKGSFRSGYPKGRGKGYLEAMKEKSMSANEANMTPCAAKGCSQPTNIAFRFCYSCHQTGKQQGYLVDNQGRKVSIKPKSTHSPTHKRAFEAICDSLSEGQMASIVAGGKELRADVATASDAETLIKRIRSSSGQ
jgi:hypothetical protein